MITKAVPEAESFSANELEVYRPTDVQRICEAENLAADAYAGQIRSNGDAYMIHPIRVARILIHTWMDTDTVCEGLLHDVIEDTRVDGEQIRQQCGVVVADLVQDVTNISKLNGQSRTVQKASTIPGAVCSPQKYSLA